ncbi:uncharacterized protein LOC116263421 isoform X2 [Nymphaea colorata]|uniref:uncharacterized protein LOC116263421 isoform X2 n=1 Tax=Nymphaea colorata TaxID=210225 RepID=UPI00214E405F|nr:uncharacterized protein LOC116263421 isoform X2 [Nymphaea colorata]
MFRKKLLLHAATPFPLHNTFIDLQLTLHCEPHPPRSLFLEIETLCWRVSREFRVACVAEDDKIHIVYQRSQSEAVSKAVIEFRRTLRVVSQVETEEEVKLSSFVNRVIECSLRSMLLNANWRCLDDGFSFFSSFSSNEEKTDIYAIQVTAKISPDNDVTFVVSPDLVNFTRHKVMDLIGTGLLQIESNKEVSIDKEDFVTACTVLPTLTHGHVIGLSRSPPGEIVLDYEELLLHKYGLGLAVEHFLKVKFTQGGFTKDQWLPSIMVLQGSGLMPVPQTVRASKSISVLEFFIKSLEEWNFFDGGYLKIKAACQLGECSDRSLWTKASSSFSLTHVTGIAGGDSCMGVGCGVSALFTASDFRTPRPPGAFLSDETFNFIQKKKECAGVLDDSHGSFAKEKPNFRPVFVRHKQIIDRLHLSAEKVTSLLSAGRSESQSYLQKLTKAVNIPLDKHDSSKFTANTGWSPRITMPNSQEKESFKPTSEEEVAPTTTLMCKNTSTCDTADGATQNKALGGILSYKKNKIRSGEEQPVYKKRACTQLENADMTSRVVEQYMRHQLESLTVSELKSFLSAKNAKVGGRKEELIMREKDKDDDVEKTDDSMFVLELVLPLENKAVQAWWIRRRWISAKWEQPPRDIF